MFSIILEITGVLTKPKASLAILNLVITGFHCTLRMVILHALVAAKMMIARHWTKHLAPNPSEVLDLVNVQYSYERRFSHKIATWVTFDK